MAISKATICGDTFSTFFTLLNSNIANPHGSSKWIFSSEPDKEFGVKSDYPIIIIEPAKISWDDLTLASKYAMIEVTIRILGTSWGTVNGSVGVDAYRDEIINLVETNRDDLRAVGLSFLQLSGTDSDSYLRGAITVHEIDITFEMAYKFDTTRVY